MNPYFPRPSLTVSRHRRLREKKVYTGNPLDKGIRKDTPIPAPFFSPNTSRGIVLVEKE